MEKQNTEKMLRELQETVEAQGKKIQRADDIREIQNLMGRYEAWHTAGMHDKVLELFAKHTAGVSIEIPHFGRWEGFEGVRKCWEVHNIYEGDRAGFLAINVDATPIIEVAGDGQTAKGMWTAMGCVTPLDDEGKRQAIWSWKRYAMGFVKEDGQWKIWHFRVYPVFATPYERSWVEESLSPSRPTPETMSIPDDLKPDKPFSPYYSYETTTVLPYAPEVPLPYEKWDDSGTY